MRSLILLIVLLFEIISFVQTRLMKNPDYNLESSEEYFIKSPNYLDVLTYLKNQQINKHKYDNDDDNDDNNNNQPTDDIMARQKKQSSFINPRFFRYEKLRSSHAGRPSNSYGRKSHWDTFFGRK